MEHAALSTNIQTVTASHPHACKQLHNITRLHNDCSAIPERATAVLLSLQRDPRRDRCRLALTQHDMYRTFTIGPPLDHHQTTIGPPLDHHQTTIGPPLDYHWTTIGPIMAQSWSNGGPMVVQWWSNGGPMVVQWWSNGGPMVVQWWSMIGP